MVLTMAMQAEAMVLKFREVLAETERLSADQMRAYQEQLLTPLILHAQRNVPFYRDRLQSLCNGAGADLSRWSDLPILTRADVQQHLRALSANVIPPHVGDISTDETSGSTGRPVRYLMNQLAVIASSGTTDRSFRWWNFDGEKALASFVARSRSDAKPPEGKTEKGWRAGTSGAHHMIDLSANADMQIEWLQKRNPDYLTAHSFILLEIAERARKRDLRIPLDRIVSIGTVLTEEIRSACGDAFGVRPIDQYGAQETGLLASECPWCGYMHVNAETALVEILDPNGEPSPPGAIGRVIVTPFYNYAMPLVRYEIGDLAVAGPERGKCRVKLPTLSRVLGRYRNVFTLKDGRTVVPYIPVSRLRELISFEQYQVVQTGLDLIEVRYVPLDRSKSVDAEALEACVRETIDPSLKARPVPVDTIARSPSGKYEDYISLVPRRTGPGELIRA
jgi:phenylacetate-CoA ligase